MKRFYLFAMMAGMGVSAMAQNSQTKDVAPFPAVRTAGGPNHVTAAPTAKGDGPTVYFTEDFDGGFETANGTWTTDGANGNLWFYTFPQGEPNGYDPDVYNSPAYDALPGYWTDGSTIESPTADNGFMMIDADAYNSDKLTPEDDPAPTDNPIEAFLISPSFDITGATNAALQFYQGYRLFVNPFVDVDISFDGGSTWTLAYEPVGAVSNVGVEGLTIADITNLVNGASDLTNVKLRFRWPYFAPNSNDQTNSHYYWMVDDISITSLPDNDLVVQEVFYQDWVTHYSEWENGPYTDEDLVSEFEYEFTPYYLTQPLNFVAIVKNNGAMAQTGVGISVTLTDPDGGVETFTTEAGDLVTLESGTTDTLVLNDQMPGAFTQGIIGQYMVDISIIQNEVDENPADNAISKAFDITLDVYQAGDDLSNLPLANENYILGQRYWFNETTNPADEIYITGVEFVILNSASNPSTEGEIIFANVRKGSIFGEEPTTVIFDPENPILYEDEEISYVTVESEMYTSGDLVWAGVDFPNPVLIDPNWIYQAEVRIPDVAGQVKTGLDNGGLTPEGSGAVIIDETQDPESTWGYFGNFSAMVRFKTDFVENTSQITFENGMSLAQNYPNPFTDRTGFSFKLPAASDVNIEIRDIQGRLIDNIDLGTRPQGVTDYEYNNGKSLAPGIYTYSVVTDMGTLTRKMSVK